MKKHRQNKDSFYSDFFEDCIQSYENKVLKDSAEFTLVTTLFKYHVSDWKNVGRFVLLALGDIEDTEEF